MVSLSFSAEFDQAVGPTRMSRMGHIRTSRMLPASGELLLFSGLASRGDDCVSSRTVEQRGGTTAGLRTPGS